MIALVDERHFHGMLSMIADKRPPKLYYFSERAELERSLTLGEFRLVTPPQSPLKATPANDANYLILSLAQSWDGALFEGKRDSTAYLVVHDAEAFGERLHRAVQKILPNWAGIDAAMSYGASSPLGRLFSLPKERAAEKEWRFAWRPMRNGLSAKPVVIQLGSIADIAELRLANA